MDRFATTPSAWQTAKGVGFVLASGSLIFALVRAAVRRILEARAKLERTLEDLATSHERTERFVSHIKRAREDERARLARELHDALGSTFTGLKLLAQSPQNDETMALIASTCDEGILLVRRLATELRPAVLDQLGLAAALDWLAGRWEDSTGLPVVRSLPEDVPVAKDDAIHVFRIAQEALTNVARHAGATRVELSLELSTAGELVLTIIDDGRGLDVPMDHESFGLANMHERARMLGGRLSLEPRHPSGLSVRLLMPLPELR
ncbi:MAG: sensor histidine kinase [Myxococcales bacterium]|nr:sensor histidine kinase [Myxococcales bacterium]